MRNQWFLNFCSTVCNCGFCLFLWLSSLFLVFSSSTSVCSGTFKKLLFCLESAELLKSLNFCLSLHLGNLGHYFFKYLFFPIFSSFSFCGSHYIYGWPFELPHRSLKLSSFLSNPIFLWFLLNFLKLLTLSSFILLHLINQYWHVVLTNDCGSFGLH